jgi:hypothetical protein
MSRLIHRLPTWAIQAWMVLGSVVMVGALLAGLGAAVTLHRENDALSREVRVQREAVEQLKVVSEVQDGVLDKANRKLKRLGETPVGSPFPFSFAFGVAGTAFKVTCTEPGEDCLVETY